MNGERVTGVVEWLNGWLATKTWPSLICRTLPLSVLHAKYRNSHCRQSSTSTSITHWLRQEISLTCPKTRGQKAQLFCPVNCKPYSRKTGALIKNLFSPVEEGREVRGLRRVEEKRQEERWSWLAFSLPAPSLSDHTNDHICLPQVRGCLCLRFLKSRVCELSAVPWTTEYYYGRRAPHTWAGGGGSQLVWGGQRQPIPKMIPKWWGAPICSRWLPPGRHLVSPMIIIQFYGGGVRTTLCKQSLWIYHWSRQTLHCVTRATQVGW